MFSKIHHVAIICSNYEKSKYFYTQILRLPIIQEIYQEKRGSYKLDLQVGGKQIELFYIPHAPKRASYPEACGLRHLAFEVTNISESINYLSKHNINCEPIRIDEYTHKKFTFFADPDGLPLELYQS